LGLVSTGVAAVSVTELETKHPVGKTSYQYRYRSCLRVTKVRKAIFSFERFLLVEGDMPFPSAKSEAAHETTAEPNRKRLCR